MHKAILCTGEPEISWYSWFRRRSMTTRRNGMRIKWRNGTPFRHLTSLLYFYSKDDPHLNFRSLYIYTNLQTGFASDDRWPCLRTHHRTRARTEVRTILGMNWLESKTISVIELRLLINFSLAPHWDMSVAHILLRAYHVNSKSSLNSKLCAFESWPEGVNI